MEYLITVTGSDSFPWLPFQNREWTFLDWLENELSWIDLRINFLGLIREWTFLDWLLLELFSKKFQPHSNLLRFWKVSSFSSPFLDVCFRSISFDQHSFLSSERQSREREREKREREREIEEERGKRVSKSMDLFWIATSLQVFPLLFFKYPQWQSFLKFPFLPLSLSLSFLSLSLNVFFCIYRYCLSSARWRMIW